MGNVFWNMAEIPIPPEAYRHLSDHSVRIVVYDADGKPHEKTIGYFTSQTHMHPNKFFRLKYPAMWENFYGKDDLLPSELYMGMYVLALAIGYKTALYPLLQAVYGPEWGNAIIDYCMYSILFKSTVTQSFSEEMEERVLFSRKMYSDSDYSELFKSATKDQHHRFKSLWLKRCVDKGITKVWICIDGSNIDNQVADSEYSENGCAKSHNQKTIVSFMYAVCSVTGMPIYYLLYEGATADSKKLEEMMDILTGHRVSIEGVVLDRGFCTDDVITYLQGKGIDFVIMMPSHFHGSQTLKEKYSDTIRDKSRFAVDDEGVFGISEETQLFTKHDTRAIVNIYYDRVRGSIQSTNLHKSICREKKRLIELISQEKAAKVAPDMKRYFHIIINDRGEQELITNYEAWDEDLMGKGFFSIISSKNFGAEKTLQIYGLRTVSEVQYSILKSQEGYRSTRVHTTPGTRSKFACAFISSIIRCEIQLACKDLDYDTNVMISRIDKRIRIILSSPPDSYTLSRAYRSEETNLLSKFGISINQLHELVTMFGKRYGIDACNQVRRIPADNKDDIQPRRSRGRPKGSKNKKTLLREAEELKKQAYQTELVPEPVKKKVGRPKGRKDTVPRKRRTKKELQNVTSV